MLKNRETRINLGPVGSTVHPIERKSRPHRVLWEREAGMGYRQ